MQSGLCLAEVAGWRALFTTAQHQSGSYLSARIDDYVTRLLFQAIGTAGSGSQVSAEASLQRFLARAHPRDLAAVGDQCLLFAGLFPGHALDHRISLASIVRAGIAAYHGFAAQRFEPELRSIYAELAEHFVPVLDALYAIRELQHPPALDPINAYQLWHDAGSIYAWRTLRRYTDGLPARVNQLCH